MSQHARSPRRAVIIVDANALFVPLQFKIDIFEELRALMNGNFELVLLTPVRRELERLAAEGSPKMRKSASYALKIAEKITHVEADSANASPDDVILKVAAEQGWLVFTNDRQLRKRLRDINVPVIYVRQKSYLAIDGRS